MYDCTKCNFKFVSCEACLCYSFIQCFCFPYIVIAQTTRYLLNFPFTTSLQFVCFFLLVACMSNVNPRFSLLHKLRQAKEKRIWGDFTDITTARCVSVLVVVKHCVVVLQSDAKTLCFKRIKRRRKKKIQMSF